MGSSAELAAARALGRRLAAEGVALAARVRPLGVEDDRRPGWDHGGRPLYLTMQFDYFYAFATLVLALPVVFARRT